MLLIRKRTLLCLTSSAFLAMPLSQALADTTESEGMNGTDGMETEERAPLDARRQLLYETVVRDDETAIEEAQAALDEAEADLAEAIDEGADPEVIAALEADRDAAQTDVDMQLGEDEALRAALEAMSDDQVDATNRALRNANANGTITDLDAATLMDIVDRDLGHREIQALTKALEEEAKFAAMGLRFEEKYERTGREKFLEQSERMTERGARQRDRFERKVDRFVDQRDAMRDEARSQVRSDARDTARENAKAEAKRAARDEARQQGRANGRGRN